MSQVITISNEVETKLNACREAVADAVKRQYGATREYAELLTQVFNSDWYTFEHNDKSEAAKPILAEADKFRKALRAAGHTNPSVIWTRVRNEGRKLVEGEPEAEGEAAEGEAAETEKAGAKEVRSLTLRLVQDLSTLYKACKREEAKNNLDAKQAQAGVHIASALQALGVDLSMVK